MLSHGYLGVDGFFILSGLVLTRVHPEMTQSLSWAASLNFWGRRLARIYPVHFAVIVLLAVLVWSGMAFGFAPRDPSRFSLPALLENLLMIQSWGFGGHWAWNYPSWSVSSEWAGYLLFPFIALALGYFDLWVMTQTIVVSLPILGFVIFLHHGTINLDFTDSLWRFFPEFIAGAATAKVVPFMADNGPVRPMIGLGLLFIIAGTMLNADLLSVLALWLFITAFAMQADADRHPFITIPGLRWLGGLSYAFYMSFATIELLITQIFRRQGWDIPSHALIFAALMTLFTLALALALHIGVEIPCRRIADRRLRPEY